MAGRVLARVQTGFGIFGVVAVIVTVSLVMRWNPLPDLERLLVAAGDRLSNFQGKLTEPPPQWTVKAGGPPETGAIVGDRVVVASDGIAEGRALSDGGLKWQREVDWAVPAGDVVVAGRRSGPGYEVLSAGSGSVRWTDAGAMDVWAYEDLVLALSCNQSGCTLRGRAPSDGKVRWQTRVDGRVTQVLSDGVVHTDDAEGVPVTVGKAPTVAGLVIDGDVTVINPRTGKRLGSTDVGDATRLWVVGDTVLHLVAQPRDGRCRYTAEGRRPDGRRVWQRDGYDAGTVDGAACEQRRAPVLGGGMLAAVGPDGRAAVIDVATGRIRWTGAKGDTVLAVSAAAVVVRNGTDAVAVVDLGAKTQVWQGKLTGKVTAFATRHGVAVVASTANRLVTVGADGKRRRAVDGAPNVLATSTGGLLLTHGRTLGYLTW